MGKILRFPILVVAIIMLCVMLLCCNFVQMLSLVLLPISGAAFRRVNCFCAACWFDSLTWVLVHVVGVEFVRTGDEIPAGEKAFVIANHQSGADIPALIAVATVKFACSRVFLRYNKLAPLVTAKDALYKAPVLAVMAKAVVSKIKNFQLKYLPAWIAAIVFA